MESRVRKRSRRARFQAWAQKINFPNTTSLANQFVPWSAFPCGSPATRLFDYVFSQSHSDVGKHGNIAPPLDAAAQTDGSSKFRPRQCGGFKVAQQNLKITRSKRSGAIAHTPGWYGALQAPAESNFPFTEDLLGYISRDGD